SKTMTTEVPKVALVTGAAKRVGRHIALALARAGWDVVIHYGQSTVEANTTVSEIESCGRRAAAIQCDLANEKAVKDLLKQASQSMDGRRISCVVNNASLFEQDDVQNFSTAQLNAHMHINLAAPIMLAQALHDATPDGSQAVVINLLDQKLFNL